MSKVSNTFNQNLISWYSTAKRNLPWRETQDPYKIWLSEIILQQTRVAQGLPYYHHFVDQFPTVKDLAEAPQDVVLRTWQGLGYYSRARNLHKTAQIVANQYGGHFPNTYEGLLDLPGVGPYTAAAIASICFNLPRPVLDGNVYRVIARAFAIDLDIAASSSRKEFMAVLEDLIPEEDPAHFNQAMMELGAIVCTPTNPDCHLCPLCDKCLALARGEQRQFPVKSKKVKVRTRPFHYIVVEHNGRLGLRQRKDKDIWQGLYEFMLVEDQSFELEKFLSAQRTKNLEVSKLFRHALTHQRIEARFYWVQVTDEDTFDELLNKYGLSAYTYDQILTLPKPKLIVNYLDELNF